MENCLFNGTIVESVRVTNNSQVSVTSCKIEGGLRGVYSGSGSYLQGSSLVIDGTEEDAVCLMSEGRVSIHGSHLFSGSGYSVRCDAYFHDEIHQDLTNNYWGTTESDSIAAKIRDGNDDPSIHSIVDFLPFSDIPLPAKASSLGSAKAMWR